jgi:sugar O-acyltransferase (sialic acid O-acetyltransferase NeuD family)
MKNLIIIGARGFGREVYCLATETKEYNVDFDIKGFLDDKADALDGYKNYPPILDSVENYVIQENDVFICALGDPTYKKKYATIIQEKGGEFISLIHPTAHIGLNSIIGKGCIICANSFISCDVTLGDFVTVQPFSMLGHDAKVSSNCQLNTYSFLGGFVEIGNNVTLHTGAIVVPHKKVYDNSIVGAGSVAIRNVKENTTVFGIPALTIN